MARLDTVFDATQIEPSQSRDVIPPGDYIAQIVNSEMRSTKAGTGRYLWLEIEITDGPQAGRHLFDRLNIENPNEKAVEIGYRALSSICHAVGKLQVEETEDLHYHRMKVVVKVTPPGPDKSGVMRDAQNEIKGYRPLKDTPAMATAAPAAPAQVSTAAQGKTPPWRR